MINSIKISDYRSISNLEVLDLREVNIFVGTNGVGKTSLLEAITLASNVNPTMHETLGKWREMHDPKQIVKTVFHQLNLKKTPKIQLLTDESRYILEIEPLGELEAENIISRFRLTEKTVDQNSNGLSLVYGLNHVYKVRGKGTTKWSLALHGDHFHPSTVSEYPDHLGVFYIHARRASSISETAQMLSEVAKDIEIEEKLFDALRIVKPDLVRLRVNYEHQMVDVVADTDSGLTLPITALGDGFCRIALMMTGVFGTQSHSLIVDEIDSGLHYTIIEKAWRTLLTTAQERQKQVFCVTHDDEMLKSTIEAFKDNQDSLRIYRLVNNGKKISAQKYDYDLFRDTVIAGMPIR